jgi:hypothetical protein
LTSFKKLRFDKTLPSAKRYSPDLFVHGVVTSEVGANATGNVMFPNASVFGVSLLQASKPGSPFPYHQGTDTSEKIAPRVKYQNVFERE